MFGSGKRQEFDHELTAGTLGRATALVGSSIAVFTFLLFFLYPRFSSNQIDATLYEITLGLIVVTIFCFGFSATYLYGTLSVPGMSLSRKLADAQKGNIMFVLGVILAVFEPALILFTIGLDLVALLATGLWLLFTLFIIRQAREQ